MFRRHIRAKMLAVLGILSAFIVAGAIYLSLPKTVVMTLTPAGWVPQQVNIHAGDTVIFKNESGRDFWPASGQHPTHLLHAGFDPKRSLPPGGSWEFTFTQPGSWPMHDHLAAQFRGTIVVEGSPGEAADVCRARAKEEPALAPACWESEILAGLRSGGIEEAFKVFDALYKNEPGFQANCHDATHALGAAAYRLFSSDQRIINRTETTYCGYGFYHGFIETMFIEEGPAHYGAALKYCEAMRTSSGEGAEGPCYHGIGHATFDSLDGSLWGDAKRMVDAAFAICERLLPGNEVDRVQCSDGVNNALGNALSAQTYDLSHNTTDIIALCMQEKKEYRRGCIVQAGIGYIRHKQMDRAESLAFIKSLAPELIPYGIETYINNEVLLNIAAYEPQEYRDACLAFKETAYRTACIAGVLGGLWNLGDPKALHVPMFGFCASFSDSDIRLGCYESAVRRIPALSKATEEYKAACAALEDAHERAICEGRQ